MTDVHLVLDGTADLRVDRDLAMTKRKILVVDDDRKIVDLVRLYLEKDGYRVSVAYDGLQALEMARRNRPDLMVLDLMPSGDGWA